MKAHNSPRTRRKSKLEKGTDLKIVKLIVSFTVLAAVTMLLYIYNNYGHRIF